MRIVKEEQKYWDYKQWKETLAWYYQPLIDNKVISNFDSKVELENDYVKVEVQYVDSRELGDDQGMRSLPKPEPKQLPPHIKVDNIVTLTAPAVNDILDIFNHFEDYWPGMWIETLSISQTKDDDAVGILTLANYEAEIEEEEDEEGELKYNE